MKKIMIVEDDKKLLDEISNVYKNNGFETFYIDDFTNVIEEILVKNPDLVVLDLALPNTSGMDILSALKEKTIIPVLILTSNDKLDTELTSFDLGADDFLTKPVDARRLIARSKNLLDIFERFEDQIIIKDLTLDISTNKLSYKNKFIILGQAEADILNTLLKDNPNTVNKDDLLMAVWNTAYVDENILQVNLTRLRKKLASLGIVGLIVNVRSVGYRVNLEVL